MFALLLLILFIGLVMTPLPMRNPVDHYSIFLFIGRMLLNMILKGGLYS